MNTEMYIENQRLDVSKDISALLNFALADIKDFSARSTTWSKTIVLPGTANNNQLFGHIFQVGQANAYDPAQDNIGYNFNAAKSADCIIFQDHIQTFVGVLRLLQVNSIKGRLEYEVSVFGMLFGLNVALSSGLLENLDFSVYNHIYNDANIVASWDNPGGSGVYYPLIDYGTYSVNKHDWDIRTFRPALYVKEYIDKMITAAGFRYSSNLFETERFEKLIIPHNRKNLTKIGSLLANATTTGPHNYLVIVEPGEGSNNFIFMKFDTASTTDFNFFASTFFQYTGANPTTVNPSATFTGSANIVSGASNIFVSLVKQVGLTTTILDTVQLTDTTATYTVSAANLQLNNGDIISLMIYPENPSEPLEYTVYIATAIFRIDSVGTTLININPGDEITPNDLIPKNIRQVDFLVSIVKLFNLYVYEDRLDPRLIHIEPYIDFYSTNRNETIDWTYKLDRNQIIKTRPMSELNAKIYKFKFKPDSDYFNELYRKRYNEGYGDRVYDSQFEFADQTKEFEIIFSSTLLVGYGGEEKVYPTIFKQSNGNEETIDSNIRILQSKKITDVSSWQIKNGTTVLSTITRYGYAGHLNDPDAPTDDLNFGVPRELFFELTTGNLSNNQFNVYWSGYMAEITDKDSKLLTASFYLNPADIAKLDFSKYIYLDGSLFRLNAIKDYNASKPTTCTVELLKVNELNFTEATPPDGPPDGNFLLWSNDNIMYYDDVEEGNELLWRDDNTSVISFNFDSLTIISPPITQSLKIYVNAIEVVSSSSDISSSIGVQVGDIVQVKVTAAGLSILKRKLEVSSDVDGSLYSNGPSIGNKSFTWTVEDSRIYIVNASITI